MRQQLRSLVTAMQFLTRLPTPDIGPPTDADRRGSYRFYPLIGLLLGVPLALLAALAHVLFASTLLVAVIAVAGDAWLTGGLHLDGLMDTADGLLSYRSRERTLEIMRDSRVGAMAVLAVTFTVLLRVATLASLSPATLVATMLTGALFARSLLLAVIRYTQPAREQGLAHETSGQVGALSVWVALGLSSGLTVLFLHLHGVIAIALATLGVSRLVKVCRVRIGGMTGDTYGASVELAQLLFACAVALRG